jgi:hypothetical protein
MRRCAILLLALLALPPSARGAPAADRAQVKQALAKGSWVRAPQRWRPLRATDGPERKIMGGLRLHTRGRALVLESHAPTAKDGVPGLAIERLYGVLPAPAAARLSVKTDAALSITLGTLGWNHLEPKPLPTLYGRALDAVAAAKPAHPDAVFHAAMAGMASGYDRWTTHLSADAYAAAMAPKAQRIGIGIHMDESDAGVKLAKVVRSSPAAKAGLRRGDTVTAVDGQAVKSSAELSQRLAGPAGARFRLSVLSAGKTRELTVEKAVY